MKYLMSRLILVTVVFGWLQQNLFAVTCDNWTYVETTTSSPDKNGKTHGSGYVTDKNEIWKFVATRALGTSNLSLSGIGGATFTDPGEKTALNFTKITDAENNEYAAVALKDLLSHSGSGTQPDIIAHCDKVTEIIAPNCTSITGEGSFRSCTSLTNAVFAEGLTISNGRTFQDCTALVDFTPRKFNTLNYSVFESCTSLKGTFLLSEAKILSSKMFLNCSSLEEVLAPQATTIDEYVFSGCSSITNIVLGSPVTSINRAAFEKCPKLKTEFVQSLLTSSLTTLWKYEPNSTVHHKGLVFNGCSGLEGDLVWNLKNLTTNVVPDQIFMNCNNLSSITFKTPISKFYGWAFYSASPSRLHVYMHTEVPVSYGQCAVMSATAPFPKVYLKDNFDEWLAVMEKNNDDLIRKEAFNDSSKYSGIKNWATITGCMAKDAAMCTKVNGVVDVKDKYVIGFMMYDNAKGGCWILKKPKDGLRVIVR